MAHTLVKLLTDDRGDVVDEPVWHLSFQAAAGNMTLCTGEFYGYGESACEFEVKTVERGVQCENCKAIIKLMKAVKL